MKTVKEYIDEALRDCPLSHQQDTLLLKAFDKFLTDLEAIQKSTVTPVFDGGMFRCSECNRTIGYGVIFGKPFYYGPRCPGCGKLIDREDTISPKICFSCLRKYAKKHKNTPCMLSGVPIPSKFCVLTKKEMTALKES